MPYSDNNFLDPLHIIWRKGDATDPLIDKAEYLKVVNQTVVLSEIPDKIFKVRIGGLEEANAEKIETRNLTGNQFLVNYSTGVVQLHESQEGNSLSVVYKGRGFIQYPSSRIYYQDKFNNIISTLDELIANSINQVSTLRNTVLDKVSDYEEIKELLLNKVEDINLSLDNTNTAIGEAEVATERANDAYDTTRLVFKPYLNTYNQISLTYPSPAVGWTVQVYDTGIRYRYDGISWIPIDLFGGNIQKATSTIDGLMSKETYTQLQTLQSDFTDLENKPKERVITFCFPYLNSGANSIIARFPFNGTIKSVRGICSKFGTDVSTEIDVEKSANMVTWNTLFNSSYLRFNIGDNFDNNNHALLITGVTADDLFRVNVKTLSQEIEGVTIEIKIEV